MLLPADHLVQTAFAVPVGQPVKKHFRIFGRAFLQVVCHLPGGGGNLPQRGGCGLQPIAQDQWRDLLFPPGGNELARRRGTAAGSSQKIPAASRTSKKPVTLREANIAKKP